MAFTDGVRWLLGALILLGVAACAESSATSPVSAPSAATSTAPGSASVGASTGATNLTGSAAPRCEGSALEASGGWQGATGSMAGQIWFKNVGPAACSLQGSPTVALLDTGDHAMAVQQHAFPLGDAPSQQTTPVVELAPGRDRAAVVLIQWINWCGQGGVDTVVVSLPNDQSSAVHVSPEADEGFGGVARCDDASRQSAIYAGNIQPPG